MTITGSTAQGTTLADTFELADLPDAPQTSPYGSGNVSGGRNSVTDLDPGAYKNVSLWGANSTLSLSAGTYVMRDFWIANGGTVNIDTTAGDVVLNVHHDFSTGKEVTFSKLGEGDLVINLLDNDMYFGKDVTIDADIRVWDGSFGAGNNLDFAGTIWATENVSIANGSSIESTFDLSGGYGAGVPEPCTICLIACGGVLVALRRRRIRV